MTEYNVRIEDAQGNIYNPHTVAEVTFLNNGINVEDFLGTLNLSVNNLRKVIVSVESFGNEKNSANIQAALNYVKGLGGGVVLVPSGTYLVDAVIRVPSNTKIVAYGDVVLKRNAQIGAIMQNDADGVKGNYDANKNIEIEGFTFDSNNTQFNANTTALAIGHASNILIENCEFLNCTTWHDLEINGSKRVHVKNCNFPNYNGTTEMLQIDYMGSETQFPWFGPYNNNYCENIFIEGCNFKGDTPTTQTPRPTRVNIRAIGNHSFKVGVASTKIIVKNCRFDGFAYAIHLQDVIDFYIKDCDFWDCLFGVVWEERSNASKNWILENCTFRHGAIMFNGFGTDITDCRFFFGTTNTPTNYLYGLLITKCLIEASTWNGIGGTFLGAKITQNIIRYSRGNGIYLFGGANNMVSDNLLEYNNRNNASGRADIVIGNNTIAAAQNIVKGNITSSIISGSNVSNSLYTDNYIYTSITGLTTNAIAKNNFIAGVYTP